MNRVWNSIWKNEQKEQYLCLWPIKVNWDANCAMFHHGAYEGQEKETIKAFHCIPWEIDKVFSNVWVWNCSTGSRNKWYFDSRISRVPSVFLLPSSLNIKSFLYPKLTCVFLPATTRLRTWLCCYRRASRLAPSYCFRNTEKIISVYFSAPQVEDPYYHPPRPPKSLIIYFFWSDIKPSL